MKMSEWLEHLKVNGYNIPDYKKKNMDQGHWQLDEERVLNEVRNEEKN